jgi:hypothetical protein
MYKRKIIRVHGSITSPFGPEEFETYPDWGAIPVRRFLYFPILGAILLTGYFGGAVARNVRAGSGWFETIFPALFAALVWGGIWLRDRRLRSLLAFRG